MGKEWSLATLSFEALTSVAGGVNMFKPGRMASRLPIASLLCNLENEGYGRLALESEALVPLGLVAESFAASMEVLVCCRNGECEERGVWVSLSEDLRCGLSRSLLSDLCFLVGSFSLFLLRDDLRLSGLGSLILMGISDDKHVRIGVRNVSS